MRKNKNLNKLIDKYVVCNKHRGSPRFFDVLTGCDYESAIFCNIKEAIEEAKRYWDDTYASIFYVDKSLNIYQMWGSKKKLKYKAFKEWLIDVWDSEYNFVYNYNGELIGTIYQRLFKFENDYQNPKENGPTFFKDNAYPCLKYADFVITTNPSQPKYFLHPYKKQSERMLKITSLQGEKYFVRGFFKKEDEIHGFAGKCDLTKQAMAYGNFIENKIKVL